MNPRYGTRLEDRMDDWAPLWVPFMLVLLALLARGCN